MASWKKILTASPAMGDLATGTPSNSNYLRGDGSWAAIPAGSDTTYSISAVDSGNNAIIRLTAGGSGSGTDDVTLVAGTGITITPSGDNISIASSVTNSFRTVTAGGNTLEAGETLAFTEGTNISISESGGAVTIAATDTNDDVSVANLKTRLAAGFASNAVTIGDSDDVVTIGNDLVVTGDLTVSGETTTLNVGELLVEDKIIEVATGDGGGSASNADGSGLQVNTGNTTSEPAIKWSNNTGLSQWNIYQEGDATGLPIAVCQVETTTGSPAGLDELAGSLAYNSVDGDLYFYDATS